MLVVFYLDASGRIVGQLWTTVPLGSGRAPGALIEALQGQVSYFAMGGTEVWGGQLRSAHNDH